MGVKINQGFKSRISSWDMKTDILAHGNWRRWGICQGGEDKKVDPMKSVPNTASSVPEKVASVLMNLSSIGKVKWLWAKKRLGKKIVVPCPRWRITVPALKNYIVDQLYKALFCGLKKKSHFMNSLGICSFFSQHLKAALAGFGIRLLGLWVPSRNYNRHPSSGQERKKSVQCRKDEDIHFLWINPQSAEIKGK